MIDCSSVVILGQAYAVDTEQIERALDVRRFMLFTKFVANKAKGWISKRVLWENEARQIFGITNISYLLVHTLACAYQGVRNVCFSEALAWFVFF